MLLEDAAPSTGIYIFLRKRIDLENQDTHKYRSISWLSSLLKPGRTRDPSITLINSLQIGIRKFSSAGTGQYLRDLLMELGVNNLGSLNVDIFCSNHEVDGNHVLQTELYSFGLIQNFIVLQWLAPRKCNL